MIYPTARAVGLAAAGAVVALVSAAATPANWVYGLGWSITVLMFFMADAVRSIGPASARVDLPHSAAVGEACEGRVSITLPHGVEVAEVAFSATPNIKMDDDGRFSLALDSGRGAASIPLYLVRRGSARVERLWLRWSGPLGLAWQQAEIPVDTGFPVLPDIRPVQQQGAQLFERQSVHGLVAQMNRGEGSDFDALVEFRPGMDRRAIDWKQSARHTKLLAKHYRSERNNQIVFALDSGRQMSEPVAGLPRIDRAVSAALLTAWLALKLGDRVALHAFDSRPRLATGLVSGGAGFGELQRWAADIDYSTEETNHSFALTTLATKLGRRSMIVLFTEFSDLISADFLVRASRKVVEKHLLLIVVLRDEELESIARAAPATPDDVTRAITAAALLKERQLVITRLQHLGVHFIESEHDKVGERLVQGYLDLKRRNLL